MRVPNEMDLMFAALIAAYGVFGLLGRLPVPSHRPLRMRRVRGAWARGLGLCFLAAAAVLVYVERDLGLLLVALLAIPAIFLAE